MTLIIGAEGSMGTRYKAILNSLNKEWRGLDEKNYTPIEYQSELLGISERFILCTSTDTHYPWLKRLIPKQKPILCEKPVTKDLEELREILRQVVFYDTPFHMVMQYKEISFSKREEPTSYNYFRTGNDGLYWDCMQIIGLAKDRWHVAKTSPIWRCTINGDELDFKSMDHAYVKMITKWYEGKLEQNLTEILEMHERVESTYKYINQGLVSDELIP